MLVLVRVLVLVLVLQAVGHVLLRLLWRQAAAAVLMLLLGLPAMCR